MTCLDGEEVPLEGDREGGHREQPGTLLGKVQIKGVRSLRTKTWLSLERQSRDHGHSRQVQRTDVELIREGD
jgi:hypothetical protein